MLIADPAPPLADSALLIAVLVHPVAPVPLIAVLALPAALAHPAALALLVALSALLSLPRPGCSLS